MTQDVLRLLPCLLAQQQELLASDSEEEEIEPVRPLRNFPADGLINAIQKVIEVSHPAPLQLAGLCVQNIESVRPFAAATAAATVYSSN